MPSPLVNRVPSADPGFRFFPSAVTGDEATHVVVGEYGHRAIRGMHQAVAALARSGLDLIVDDVIVDASWLDDYVDAMAGIDVIFVGVTAPLRVIEERELARGDRHPRLARGHYDVVHQDKIYDVMVDTSMLSQEACIDHVLARIQTGPGTAFDRLRERHRQ